MGWITDSVKDLVQGLPVASVLRERLALADDKYKALEAENRKLKDENSIGRGYRFSRATRWRV